jgi:hypothetical protein
MRNAWLLLIALPLAACAGTEAATEVPQRVQDELKALQLAVLEEIRQTVADNFVYPDFGGTDWESEASLARRRVETGLTEEEFAAAVDDMVAALPDGSGGFMTRAERVEAEFQSGTLKGDLLAPGIIYVLVPVAVDNTLAERVAGLLQLSDAEQEPALGLMLDLRIAGSGSSWPLKTLSDGSLLTFADSSYIMPGGSDLSLTGLTPNLLVQSDWDQVTPKSDPVIQGAIDLLIGARVGD